MSDAEKRRGAFRRQWLLLECLLTCRGGVPYILPFPILCNVPRALDCSFLQWLLSLITLWISLSSITRVYPRWVIWSRTWFCDFCLVFWSPIHRMRTLWCCVWKKVGRELWGTAGSYIWEFFVSYFCDSRSATFRSSIHVWGGTTRSNAISWDYKDLPIRDSSWEWKSGRIIQCKEKCSRASPA